MTVSQGLPFAQLNPDYRMMRETNPVNYYEPYKVWQLYRYADIQQATLDTATFSSQMKINVELLQRSFLTMDPPQHRRLRTLAAQAFTPRRVKQWETRIEALVHELLDAVVARGQMDIINDLAYPLPAIIISELLGVPPEDRDQFKHWSDAIADEVAKPHAELFSNDQLSMMNYIRQEIIRHRQQPGNDIISDLIAAEVEGEKLSDEEIVITTALLLIGGHETTTNLIGNAFLCFMRHPAALAELRADPSLLPGAVEEVLRYWSPVVFNFRILTRDITLEGKTLKAGEQVQLLFSSGNRDERAFPDADRFDIHRNPNRHLGFGNGIHFCLGAPLARLEGIIALRIMLERLPAITFFPDTLFEPALGINFQGVRNLPIAFTPGSPTIKFDR